MVARAAKSPASPSGVISSSAVPPVTLRPIEPWPTNMVTPSAATRRTRTSSEVLTTPSAPALRTCSNENAPPIEKLLKNERLVVTSTRRYGPAGSESGVPDANVTFTGAPVLLIFRAIAVAPIVTPAGRCGMIVALSSPARPALVITNRPVPPVTSSPSGAAPFVPRNIDTPVASIFTTRSFAVLRVCSKSKLPVIVWPRIVSETFVPLTRR